MAATTPHIGFRFRNLSIDSFHPILEGTKNTSSDTRRDNNDLYLRSCLSRTIAEVFDI